MCGVAATLSPAGGPVPESLTGRLRALAHRGPDGAGEVVIRLPWATVALGQTRLAIVDRRPIASPFRFPAVGVSLAYNGEVYNHRALRAELTNGLPWETDCDAEVVAHAWRTWGPACLERLNGMWGLVLVDEIRAEVFLARDRAGEKPLYVARHGGSLHVASEIKGLGVPLVAHEALPAYEALEFEEGDPEGRTLFRGVRTVLPGCSWHLRGQADVDREPTPWWTLPVPEAPDRPTSIREERDLVEEGVAVVREAVRTRATAEVPVAVLLSGGLDSAIVQAVARSERLYCVTFPEIDNLRDARTAARGRDVQAVTFDAAGALSALRPVAWHLDTPATWTSLGLWHVAQAVHRDGGVVVLSGEGADELFFGYARYRALSHLDRLAADPVLAAYGPLLQHLLGSRAVVLGRLFRRQNTRAVTAFLEDIVDRHGLGRSLVEDAARVDWHSTFSVLLRMADRMLMAHGLEGRCPFLDPAVIAWAARVPDGLKIDARDCKAILRRVATALGVPPAIAYQTTKRGLAVPWPTWFPAPGPRGPWDRAGYARDAAIAWRTAFGLEVDGAAAMQAAPA